MTVFKEIERAVAAVAAIAVTVVMIAYGNDVRFMISEEDLASGSRTRLDHARPFV